MNPGDKSIPYALSNIKKEVDVAVEFEEPEHQPEARECIVCNTKSYESHDIFSTYTTATGITILAFLSKFTDTRRVFSPDFSKCICSTCLNLVNVLEQAELEYKKLRANFISIISRNSLFYLPQPIRLECVKSESLRGGDCNDTACPDTNDKPENDMLLNIKKEKDINDDNEGFDHGSESMWSMSRPNPPSEQTSAKVTEPLLMSARPSTDMCMECECGSSTLRASTPQTPGRPSPSIQRPTFKLKNINMLLSGAQLEKPLCSRKRRAWDPKNPPAPGSPLLEDDVEVNPQWAAQETMTVSKAIPKTSASQHPLVVFPPFSAVFLECEGSMGNTSMKPRTSPSPASFQESERSNDKTLQEEVKTKILPQDPLDEADMTRKTINYGSDSGDSEDDEEYLVPILRSRVYEASLETPLDEPVQPAAPVVDVALASTCESAVGPNDFYHFEWRSFPDPPIPPIERRERFTPTVVGPVESCQDPYSIFMSIWDSQIMNRIVLETNKYAQDTASQRLHNNNLGPRSRICAWKDTCVDELYTYFAIIMAMGIVVKSQLAEYWTATSDIFITPGFRAHMTLNRFQLLNACLHFNDNGHMRGHELSPGEAKLFKIEPIINHLNSKFQSMYIPNQNMVLDESLMPRQGWLGINQSIFNKAARIGVRTYELCESQTGYLWRFTIHANKHNSLEQQTSIDAFTSSLVLDLLRGLEGKGYTVWMDNFYQSPALARQLKVKGFDVVGTLRTNRQFVPQELSDLTKLSMRKGEITGFTSGDVDVMVWRDENRLAMISTYHGNETGVVEGKVKPCLMSDFNVMMAGVDKKDQLLSTFPVDRKRTKVWYKTLFKKLLNVSVLNSFIIAKKSGSHLDHRAFRKELIISLLSRHNTAKNMPPTRDTVFMTKKHHILQYEIGSNKSRLRRKCCVCKTLTQFYCAGCEKTVCISTCFISLHS